ncbi:MAG: hypothetical protein Salg2KO_12540 [Salibacteraceae bacterium]
MRNLIEFIWKNHFTILFLVLEVIGFNLLVNQNSYHRSKLHETTLAISGKIYDLQFAYTHYLGLLDENKKLRETNARLIEERQGIPRKDRAKVGNFITIPTEAIQSTHHLENNFVVINSGRNHGVKPASAVISDDGVVGIIHTVSDEYSSILPLLHSQSQISARIENSKYFGQCQWRGIDPDMMILENIPNHVTVDSGEAIVTRGGGGVFPPGISIGHAISSDKDESTGFQEIHVRLSTDFRRLNTLYVIVNEAKPAFDSVLTQTQEWTE